MTTVEYETFLASKRRVVEPAGFQVANARLPEDLFGFQRDIVRWACRLGRAAIFAGTGLGKTAMQLAVADQVVNHTRGAVLILAPLAVAEQTQREAVRFGIDDVRLHDTSGAPGIVVTNYEKLHQYDAAKYSGIVLDECFPKGTLIDVQAGGVHAKRAIEDIKPGDIIYNAAGVDVVADIHRREVDYAVRITIGERSITCSPNHPLFTQRGWVGARDIIPGDHLAQTPTAVHLVRSVFYPEVRQSEASAILRDILLSEMADATAGAPCKSAQRRGRIKKGTREVGLARVGQPRGQSADRAYSESEPHGAPRRAGESLPPIERNRPQTFRAWGQWHGPHGATVDSNGNTWRGMASGVCLVTGQADSRLSHLLQARHRTAQSQNRHRGGWSLASLPQDAGCEEGRQVGFTRLDSLEILESGHPDLEKLRDADGKLYFYDLGATRHPSFSVNGHLVHNSSILKAYSGKVRNQIIETFAMTPYKLACTATPAPNDYMELGNHAEFLGVMSRTEMLATFFVHDGGETQKWRLKGHAEQDFWRWLCSWAVLMRKPSDLGRLYADDDYELPPLTMHRITVESAPQAGQLFAMEAQTLSERRVARRATISDRVQACAELVNASGEQWLIWCDLNDEGDALEKLIPDAVQVAGRHSDDEKARKMTAFATGTARVLVSKPSICGFGMNWQNCHNVVFVGLSDSWESYYQAIRRCWRFGQAHEVHCYVITSTADGAVVANIERKEHDALRMIDEAVQHVSVYQDITATAREEDEYVANVVMQLPIWITAKAQVPA